MTTSLTNSINGLPRRNSVQREFIKSKTVANVLSQVKPASNRRLVDLPSTATVEKTFDVLLAEDILSVPVYQLESDQHTKKYLTIVSVLDLLKLLNVNGCHREKNFAKKTKTCGQNSACPRKNNGCTEKYSHYVFLLN